MRITIATGIYPPEIGGPATYAAGLATRLADLGHTVTVVTYANVPRYTADDALPFKLVRVPHKHKYLDRWHFFRAVWPHVRRSDIVYTLDWFAAGLPVSLAARMARVPYLVRIGGDYLWEQRYLESGAEPLPLTTFYERGLYRDRAYLPFRLIISFVLRGAKEVVFNSDVQRALYHAYWGLTEERTSVLDNPVPMIEKGKRVRRTKELVFWGRFIVMKNLPTLIRAFAQAKLPEEYTLTLIGDGPQRIRLRSLVLRLGLQQRVRFERHLPHAEVLERVKHARAFILPSWTDISPNQVYEALAIGLPALVTSENYLRIREELPATFAPDSVDELADRLRMLGDDRKYRAFARAFTGITFANDWDAVAGAHVALFERTLGRKDSDVRVLSIGADRSTQGILYAGTPAYERQRAYAAGFDAFDIIGFSRRADAATRSINSTLQIIPTNSVSRLLYVFDTWRIARHLPRPDVVSTQDPFETGVAGWFIARHFRVPLHVQLHTDPFAPAYAASSFANRIRVHVARFVLRRATRVRVVSQQVAGSLTPLKLKASVSVLPIYTDLARFRAASASSELSGRFASFTYRLLCVGRLKAEKNTALAIRSFAQTSPAGSCLIVVGEGSERRKLEALAQELGVNDRVFFEGVQDPAPYYALADLVLVPSHYEGYGLVIVEALAAGKPVLATDVGVAREAGAIIATPEEYTSALKNWFEAGPRTGELRGYPYASFDEYVRAYQDDLRGCITAAKAQ